RSRTSRRSGSRPGPGTAPAGGPAPPAPVSRPRRRTIAPRPRAAAAGRSAGGGRGRLARGRGAPDRCRERSRAARGERRSAAARAAGRGLAPARDPLRREVRLLGSLLGQVIAEQGGPELFALVERIRRRTIALRHPDTELDLQPDAERAKLAAEIGALDLDR